MSAACWSSMRPPNDAAQQTCDLAAWQTALLGAIIYKKTED
jgi:hypothetical protein